MTRPDPDTLRPASQWMRRWLLAAAAYNLLFCAWAVVCPDALFRWADMPTPNYLEFWQCIGMIVGVYGIGYAIAARDPFRHWPIVLVGLLGKLFGPIGFAQALLRRTLPLRFGAILLTNDLLWWIPFVLILLGAYRSARTPRESRQETLIHSP
ncbi:MAG: alkyl hydroperoxide reductase [Isosphaeraceae bacterium]